MTQFVNQFIELQKSGFTSKERLCDVQALVFKIIQRSRSGLEKRI